jgi:hypothetical protein
MPRSRIQLAGGGSAVAEHNLYDFRQLSQNTGNIFFVDSGASASGSGLSPEDPVTTIDAAIGLCTANNGDVIFVMEGHAENLTAATSINCDVAGVTIWGLGHGAAIPILTTTAAAGSITVGAANVTLKNLRVYAGFAGGTTTGFTIAAAGDGCTLENIVMRDTAANTEFIVHVSVATTVTDLLIDRCDFRGLVAESMTNSILFAGTSANTTIRNTTIIVDSSDDTVDHLAGAATNWLMHHCTIINGDTTTALYCVRLEATSTGVTHNCQFAYNKVDAEVSLGAAAWWLRNWASNTIADGGVAEPAGAAAIP